VRLKKTSPYVAMSYGMAVFYGTAIAIIMVDAGKSANLSWFLSVSPMWVWAIAPLFIFVIFISKFHVHKAKVALLILQVAFLGGSLYLYYDAFYINLDAQSGLVFIFLPPLQYLAVLSLVGIVKITQFVGRWLKME